MTGFLKTAGFLAIALSSTHAFATFLPKNNLHLQDNKNLFANINEQQFHTIVNDIVNKYKPIVLRMHGAKLTTNNLWNDPTVNAYAQQFGESDWQINMFGGLARRPEVTPDGFAMVVCHELGHHLAGFAFYGATEWASSEGQSDYFATQACARFIWSDQTEVNARSRAIVPAIVKNKCDAQWHGENEQNLCYRTSLAGESLAVLLGAIGSGNVVPKFETPDAAQVSSTYTAHPAAQCRLDTYFAGGLCTVNFNNEIIPGKKFSNRTSVDAENEAAATSCMSASGHTEGVRPRCWFKPGIDFLGIRLSRVEWRNANSEAITSVKPGEVVTADVVLGNQSTSTTFDVNATLTSDSAAAKVTRNQASYGDIASGSTKNSAVPFEVSIASNAVCGTKLNFVTDSTGKTANDRQVSASFKNSMMIGRIVELLIGQVATTVTVPDNKPAGITQTLVSTASEAVSSVLVGIKFNHSYPRDLKATLTSPSNVRKEVNLSSARAGQNELAIETSGFSGSAAGTWTLNVADTAQADVGTLQGWSLKMLRGSCD